MSISQLNTDIARLRKEIASYQDKLAREKKNESDKRKQIQNIQKSINKNTSNSTLRSKQWQCNRLESDIYRSVSKQADLQKEIAKREKTMNDKSVALSKEQAREDKKKEAEHNKVLAGYENKVKSLQKRLRNQTNILTLKGTSQKHIYVQSDDIKYDVFISHASEDKQSFVDDFVNELRQRDVKVWYDSISISWGDNLRTKIDEGLRNSRYGIVILSRDYIKKGWPQYELESLFNIEMMNGKTILPIWHNITKAEVMKYSPAIGGRLALNTSDMTPSEIADEVVKLIKSDV